MIIYVTRRVTEARFELLPTMAVASVKGFMIVLIFYRVKNTRLKPNNKKKKVIHSRDVFKFACNLDSWLYIISFITNNSVPALDSAARK